MLVLQLSLMLFLSIVLIVLFFILSKNFLWEMESSASFECGFSSYFFSRFSFSIHYFLVGLIFLVLDLELCILFPLISELSSFEKSEFLMFFFILALLLGLGWEWISGQIDWKS